MGVRWPACGPARPASARDTAGPPSSAVVATEAQTALPPCRPVPPCAALCRPVLGVQAWSRGCQLVLSARVGGERVGG